MTHYPGEMTIAQMSKATGISAHTLRYYERADLLRPVARNSGNQRRYSATDVAWVAFLLRLRNTGMPIAQMSEYARLREAGPETTRARLAMLETHRARLREQLAELRVHEKALSAKITLYREDAAALESTQQNGAAHD